MRESGFTIFELIAVVSIVAISASLAVPSFRETIRNNRIITTSNDVLTGLTLARTEAIRRNQTVTICGSSDPEAAVPSCVGTGAWTDGWVVFVDADNNTQPTNAAEIVRKQAVDAKGIEIIRSGGASRISFTPNGLALTFNSTVSVCDDRKGDSSEHEHMRNVILNNSGRLRIAPPTTAVPLAC